MKTNLVHSRFDRLATYHCQESAARACTKSKPNLNPLYLLIDLARRMRLAKKLST
jgi:hypothetical protein